MKRSVDTSDPLTRAMAPPPNETPEARQAREEREECAREVSKRIDAELKLAKAAMKKKERAVKLLVLGQSLSGKSTTIKNFQITYAQRSWAEERESWKAVIFLNLARSVNTVVDILAEEMGIAQGSHANEDDGVRPTPHAGLTEHHRALSFKLAPLRQIERDLKTLLGSGSAEVDDSPKRNSYLTGPQPPNEFTLRSTSGWKTVLDRIRNPSRGKDQQLQKVASGVIISLKDDIHELWNNRIVQQILRKHHVRLEDTPGFFLQDIYRIARPDYVPSDSDVVRARLRTTGVQEYHFTLDRGTSTSLDWFMYDVAGARTSRAAWIPYFKDITGIIFLAPLSAFNETLPEDPSVNSVHDTFSLWKTVCASKLLANVQLILFLNKTDLLQRKLKSGLMVGDYLPEYQESSNDFATVTTWFRRAFARIYKDHSPPKRKLIAHFTSVVDTKATAQTLAAVQAVILHNDVTEAGLV
ncbi:putative G protein alpha subunit [Lyophyllum shimeji]|uniref:G protein alpha subunit n=1 Tax=Lyophyllum shimeji TaxID=47721 RepID=A0A9P3PKW3_LYOSH|nr:putative G protein alpha subunit [Lyophyllum shimeji]